MVEPSPKDTSPSGYKGIIAPRCLAANRSWEEEHGRVLRHLTPDKEWRNWVSVPIGRQANMVKGMTRGP